MELKTLISYKEDIFEPTNFTQFQNLNMSVDHLKKLIEVKNEQEFLQNFSEFKLKVTQTRNNWDETLASLLYQAISSDSENLVQFLIIEGANVNFEVPNKSFSIVDHACQQGIPSIVKAIFDQKPKLYVDTPSGKVRNVLHLITENLWQDQSGSKRSYAKCFEIVINHCDKIINQKDVKGGATPLHYATKHGCEEVVMKLLEKGADIYAEDIYGNTPLDFIRHDTLKKFLDERITNYQPNEIVVDFGFLNPQDENLKFHPEIESIEKIAQIRELRPLIAHPVLASFLYLKWSKYSKIFVTNLIVVTFFMLILICYVVRSQTRKNQTVTVLRWICIIGVTLVAIREILQFVLSFWKYFKSFTNYLEIFLVISGYAYIFLSWDGKCQKNNNLLKFFAVSTIMLASWEIFILIGTLPCFSISIFMVTLKKVTATFLKFMILCSVLILSFAESFYVIFGVEYKLTESGEKRKLQDDENAFSKFTGPGIAVLKTLIMLTGEFDASELFETKRHMVVSTFFLIFAFLMTIVLYNLIQALAFDDTQKIREEGELIVLYEKIKVLRKYENQTGYLNWMTKKSSRQWLKADWVSKKINVFTGKNRKIAILPQDNNRYELPIKSPINREEAKNSNDLEMCCMSLKLPFVYTKIMDENIMRKIDRVLAERKNKNKNLNRRLQVIESNIEELMKMMREILEGSERKFN